MIDSRPSNPSGEDGVVLVWTALMVFGLLGLAALVIDLGQLRNAQQRMLVGAETAALEAIRFRDERGDSGRRDAATAALGRLFDDDFDPTADAMGVGAGAVVGVVAREPTGNFSPRVEVGGTPSARVYKPTLQGNSTNAQHGDIVAGTHQVPAGPVVETSAFQRTDFLPVPQGSTPTELQQAPDVLVRLRRTAARNPLDRDPGISSAGPPIPLLFGFVGVQPGPPGSYNPRTDGLSIRATAIAGGRRALVVSNNLDGGRVVAPLVLDVGDPAGWNGIAAGSIVSYTIDGPLLRDGAAGPIRGRLTATLAQLVGQAITTTTTAPTPTTTEAIVPVSIDRTGQPTVVGFTLALLEIRVGAVQLTKRPGQILSTGASTQGNAALDARIALQANPDLATAHAAVADPVLAPTLLR